MTHLCHGYLSSWLYCCGLSAWLSGCPYKVETIGTGPEQGQEVLKDLGDIRLKVFNVDLKLRDTPNDIHDLWMCAQNRTQETTPDGTREDEPKESFPFEFTIKDDQRGDAAKSTKA